MRVTVNADRLWGDLMEIAKIGGTSKGGCNRQALTDSDIEGRALFSRWCGAFGFTVSYDRVGNLFARMPGRDDSLAPLVFGSHLDTQPTGGKFDGVLGVLAGLEVMRVMAERGLRPERPVEVAAWMNEEGARFAPAMMGSGVFAGMLDLDEVRQARDQTGISVGEELDRHGYSAGPHPAEKKMAAYIELHIEQGPLLEEQDKAIGIVTGAQGIRWYDLSVEGQETHAGPMPMPMRRDPMTALPELIGGILAIGTTDGEARATIGQLQALPGSRNVVPGRIDLTVDLRHPDEQRLTGMHEEYQALLHRAAAANRGLSLGHEMIWHSPAVAFDPDLIGAVRESVQAAGYTSMDIVSGAGHDALMVARKVPTTMIFVPCRGGISHNEAEETKPSQAEAGANVLLATALNYLGVA